MATGRNATAYDGIGFRAHTFQIDGTSITYDATQVNGSAQVGLAVSFAGADTVGLTNDADHVVGKLLEVDSDLWATVQLKGNAQFAAGASATVSRGVKIVGALGASSARGYIRNAVASESPKQGGEILNIDDTTAVWVDLG